MDSRKCFGIIHAALSLLKSVYDFPHNPKVAGSNPAPATKKLQILNGFRMRLGGRFYVWTEFRQILGKESLVQKCSKLPG
jgi:hypothetical protein